MLTKFLKLIKDFYWVKMEKILQKSSWWIKWTLSYFIDKREFFSYFWNLFNMKSMHLIGQVPSGSFQRSKLIHRLSLRVDLLPHSLITNYKHDNLPSPLHHVPSKVSGSQICRGLMTNWTTFLGCPACPVENSGSANHSVLIREAIKLFKYKKWLESSQYDCILSIEKYVECCEPCQKKRYFQQLYESII